MGLFHKKPSAAAPLESSEANLDTKASTQAPTSWWSRLKSGLAKTVGSLFGGIKSLVLGRRLDDELIDEIETALLGADLGPALTEQVIQRLRTSFRRGEITQGEQVLPFLKQQFIEILTSRSNQVDLATTPPSVILVVGVNGTGKTTSIGKLAWHYTQAGKRVMIAACDTFRAAAESQLEIWATQRVGCAFHKGEPKADPASVAFTAAERAKAEGIDVLIVDTAGRLHNDKNLMEQLSKIKRSLQRNIPEAPHEVLLVLDANYGQNAISQAEGFFQSAGVTGLFLAKLDATGKGGVVLNIHQRFSIPVKFIGTGEQRDDFSPFDAVRFVDALFADA